MEIPPLSAWTYAPEASARPRNAEEAARQFESLLIAQLLRSARESGWGSGQDDAGSESSTMLDLAEQQFARLLSQKGGLHLSRLILEGLNTRSKDALLRSP